MSRPTGPGVRALAPLVLTLLVGSSGCGLELMSPEDPGALVPPVADEDPRLPGLDVTVAGLDRRLHLRTFGDPSDPVALVLPGGPGADFRLLLPLQELSGRYFVVMWDPRGAGLSERVGRQELTLESFVDEIEAVRAAVAGGRPVTLIGHSFGALVMLRYTAERPGAVDQLVLIDPGPVTPSARRGYRGGAVGFAEGQDHFWQNEVLTSRDHAAADYRAVALLPEASRSFTCSGEPPDEYPMWRFGAYQYHVVLHRWRAVGDELDWSEGIGAFDGPILMMVGTCGAAAEDVHVERNLAALPGAELVTVQGAGHLSLFTHRADETLRALRERLLAHGDGAGQP